MYIPDGLCALGQTTEPQFPHLKNTRVWMFVCGDFEGPSDPDILCLKSAVFIPGFTLESPGDL